MVKSVTVRRATAAQVIDGAGLLPVSARLLAACLFVFGVAACSSSDPSVTTGWSEDSESDYPMDTYLPESDSPMDSYLPESDSPMDTYLPEPGYPADTYVTEVTSGDADQQVRDAVDAIARGCSAYAGAYGYGPSGEDVSPDGDVAQFVDPWPTNPFTGEPMRQGFSPGDFEFETAISMGAGQRYQGYVHGYLGDGSIYSRDFRY